MKQRTPPEATESNPSLDVPRRRSTQDTLPWGQEPLTEPSMSVILYTMSTKTDSAIPSSFEEKSVWIQLAGLLLTLGGYFVVAGTLLARGATSIAPFVPLFIIAIVLMIVVFAAGHAIAAMVSRPEGGDERDRLITGRAEAKSSWVLGVGVIGAVGCLIFAVEPAWTANLLLLSMFLSQAIRYAFQIVYHRRGF